MKKTIIILISVFMIVLLWGCSNSNSVTPENPNNDEPTTVVDLPTTPGDDNPSPDDLPQTDDTPTGSEDLVIPKEQLENGLSKAKSAADNYCKKQYKSYEDGCYEPAVYKRVGYKVSENILTVTYLGYVFYGQTEYCDPIKITVAMKYSLAGSWEADSVKIKDDYYVKMKNVHGAINIRDDCWTEANSLGKLAKGKTIKVYGIIPKKITGDKYNWYCIDESWSEFVADKGDWFSIVE